MRAAHLLGAMKGLEGEAARLFVYYVKNGRAEAVAEVLSEAFAPAREQAPRARLAPGAERVEVGATVRTTGAVTAAFGVASPRSRRVGGGSGAGWGPRRSPASVGRERALRLRGRHVRALGEERARLGDGAQLLVVGVGSGERRWA